MTRKGDPKPNGAVVAVVQALGDHVVRLGSPHSLHNSLSAFTSGVY